MPGPERRLSAIVSADVVGYSRLMADDEDSTVRTVEAYREQIELHVRQHQGRMQFTGDNFLAEFGSAVEAVRCATEIQRVIRALNADLAAERRMQFRMGIHLGDVRVEGERLFGTGVNIAARLESLAEPGGLCISGTVREQLQGTLDLDFEDLGEQQVKNIPDPVHAFRVRVDAPARPGAEAPRTTTRRYWAAGAGALALLLAVAVATWHPLEPAPPSIAVLPFENMSDDPGNEYFSDGISEELLNLLARIPDLKVIGRTSSFAFKGRNEDLRVIGETLGVKTVLEGSVRKSGDRVRITAQLVDVSDGAHRWSETYERTLGDIFATQDEIATRVVEQLKVSWLGDAATVQANDPEAYALVLQARYLERQNTLDSTEKSIALLEQALAIDPDYAAAWAGLAGGYTNQANQGLRPFDEGFTLAREAASQALALDPAYAAAHRWLGFIAQYHDRDFVAAARHYERALAMEPANTDSIAEAATLAAYLGRPDQAIALAEYAVARDPVNPLRSSNLGLRYLDAGRLDEAIASLRTTLTLSPDYIGAQYFIGEALLLKGEPESALAAVQKEVFEYWRLIGLVMAHHALDQGAASDAALARLIEEYEQEAAYNIAYALAFRGEADLAFEWLNKAVAYNDPGLAEIAVHVLFANIRSDPRWLPFLESIGMSPEQLAAIEFKVTLPE